MKTLYSPFLRFLFALLLGTLVAAAGGAQERVDPGASTAGTPSGDYLIGPGDSLQVFVWGQPELSVTVPVRPDGRVSTPLIEDVEAVGKTPTQLAREMEKILAEYIRTPTVNISIQKFVGTFGSQIRVLGQVAKPGAVPYRDKMTLLDVISEVGGLTKFAAGNRSRLVRAVNGRTEELRVRLNNLVNRGKIEENVLMQPGDVVVVPEAVF